MSSPPVKYLRYFDFTNFATLNPEKPLPGASVDVELNRLKVTTDQTIDRLALIQRDDGSLNATIGTAQLVDKSVTEPKLADKAVSTRALGDAVVGYPQLQPAAVNSIILAPNAAGTIHIIDGAVTGPKIANGSIDNTKLGNLAVSTGVLIDGCVTEPKLGSLSVSTRTLQDQCCTTPKIADAAVTSAKLAASLALAGIPTAPTPATGTNTTQLATTAFVAASMSAAGAITEAPNDGALYGRQALGWQLGVKLAGDVMTGALQVPAVKFGGATAAFPMWKNIGAVLHARLADDSGFADIFGKGAVLTAFSGIGRTPEAGWGAGFKGLALGATGSIFGDSAGNGTYTGVNLYYDGAAWRYILAAPAGLLGMGGGNYDFYSAPAGAAGAVAPLTKTMSLDGQGNLTLLGNLAAPSVPNPNKIINGDFRIDQQNGSQQVVPSNGTFIADCWQMFVTQPAKFNTQCANSIGAVSVGSNITSYISFQNQGGVYNVGAGDNFSFATYLEGLNFTDFCWGTNSAKPATLSFWAYHNFPGTYSVVIRNVGATHSYLATYNVAVAGAFQKYVIPIPAPNVGAWNLNTSAFCAIEFTLDAGTNSQAAVTGAWAAGVLHAAVGQAHMMTNAGGNLSITGVKLELGSVATPFVPDSHATALEKCMRYYFVDSLSRQYSFWLDGGSAEYCAIVTSFPVAMRIAPAISFVSIGVFGYNNSANAGVNFTPAGGTPQGGGNELGGMARLNTISNPQGAANIYRFGQAAARIAYDARV